MQSFALVPFGTALLRHVVRYGYHRGFVCVCVCVCVHSYNNIDVDVAVQASNDPLSGVNYIMYEMCFWRKCSDVTVHALLSSKCSTHAPDSCPCLPLHGTVKP